MKHHEAYFKGYQNFNIFYQCWLPEGYPNAILLIAHGFAEHSGRYGNIVNYFVPRGYAVYALDHRGHGKSQGERVHVDDFHDYVIDLKTFFDITREKNPANKIFLIGSIDKTFKPYAGLLHEIFNEPEYPQVMTDIEEWLKNHI